MRDKNRGFYALLLSSSISSIGDGIRTLIVPLIILYITGSSFLFGLILSAEFLVWIISAGLTGYFIDKTNRVKNLFYSNLILSILMMVVSVSYFVAHSYFILFIAIATIGVSIGEAFFNPASFSLLPDIVHRDLDKHNALMSMAVNASLLGGYLIAGFGFYVVSWGILLGIDALSFLISAVIIYFGLREYGKNEKVEKIHFWQDTKDTFAFLKTQKVISYTIIFGIIFNFLTSGIIIIIPTIAVKNTSMGPFSLSLFYISELIGMILGGTIIVTRKRNVKLLNYLFAGSAGEGFIMLSIALSLFFTKELVVIVVMLILLSKGIFAEIVNIPYRVWYQKLVPKDIRAKIYNIKDLILTIPMVITYPIVGYFLDNYSVWIVIFIFGFFTVIISIFEYILLREVLGQSYSS